MDRNKIKKRLIFWNLFVWLFLIIAVYQGYFVYFVDLTSTKSKWIGLFAGAVAILTASIKILENLFYCHKDTLIQKIVSYFHKGALIFFKHQLRLNFIIALIACWILYEKMGKSFLICFVSGILTFLFSYYISVFISSRTIVRVVKAVNESSNCALRLSLNSGIVSSMMGIGLSLSVITILFHLFKDYQIIGGFLLGAGLSCVFSCVSTAIIKKSVSCVSGIISGHIADIDLYDKRSPVLLLDGLSKMVFNVNSISSDMFLTFCAVLISSMTIGAFAYNLMGCFLPIAICASGVFASIFVVLLLNINKTKSLTKIVYFSVFKAVFILCALSFYCIKLWIPDVIGLFYSVLLGSICSILVCFISSNYIFSDLKPVKNVANVAISGFLPTFLQSLREGFMSIFMPVFVIALSIIFSFLLSEGIESPLFGIYGITLFVLSMVSTMGVILCINNFSVILNSSNEVVKSYESTEISLLEDKKESYLGDAAYNSALFGKNFFNASAVLCAVLVLVAYTFVAELEMIDILNPYVLAALFLGASIPFLYIAFILSGVNKTSKRLVLEAKKQFRNFPQILRFEMRPDYEKCVDIASGNSTIQAAFYTFLVIFVFMLIALYLKIEAVGGFIIGIILTSCCLLFFASNSSFVARNAKKYLRREYENSNLSDEYAVLIQNDEVFSSIKDLFVPILKNLIKFIAILALTLAPLFM